nr:hypothetical protein [Ruegeria sp. HKCCD6157]
MVIEVSLNRFDPTVAPMPQRPLIIAEPFESGFFFATNRIVQLVRRGELVCQFGWCLDSRIVAVVLGFYDGTQYPNGLFAQATTGHAKERFLRNVVSCPDNNRIYICFAYFSNQGIPRFKGVIKIYRPIIISLEAAPQVVGS